MSVISVRSTIQIGLAAATLVIFSHTVLRGETHNGYHITVIARSGQVIEGKTIEFYCQEL